MGDDFANNTVHEFLKGRKKLDGTPDTYVYAFYEVREFTTTRNSNNDKNVISRIRNAFITALNEHASLPKLVVFILDDDVITNVKLDDNLPLVPQYEYILCKLMTFINRSIEIYKDMLPQKAKRDVIPHLLWIAPPNHKYFSDDNNEKRGAFTTALSTSVSTIKNSSMLRMVKFWDMNNSNLFLEDAYRFTVEGLNKYWMSVDASIRFWALAISKKFEKQKKLGQDTNNLNNAKESGEPSETESNINEQKDNKHESSSPSRHTSRSSRTPDRRESYYKSPKHRYYNDRQYYKGYYDRYRWRNPGYKNDSRCRRLRTPP